MECTSLKARNSGVGKLILSGTADQTEINSNGVNKIDATELNKFWFPEPGFFYFSIKLEDLEKSVLDAKLHTEALDLAKYYRESVFMNMQQLRAVVDELETLVSKKYWTLPSYGELLFSVN